MKDMEQGGNAAQLNGSDTVSGNTQPERGTPQPGADMPGADMPGADMPGADMPGADMPGAGDMPENTGEVEVPVKKSEKKRLFIIAAVVAVLALIIGISFFSNGKDKRLQEQLDLGAKYIDELEYEQALACYLSAVEIDPMSVDAYLGIIEVYIRTGEYDLALEWAEKGYELTGDEQLAEKIEMIKSGNISRWDGQPVKATGYNEDGSVSWWHEYSYDSENRKSGVTHYDKNGNLIKTLPVVYDESGNEINGYVVSLDNGKITKRICEYDGDFQTQRVDYGDDDVTIKLWEVFEKGDDENTIKSAQGESQNIGKLEDIVNYTESEYDAQGNRIKWRLYDKDYNLEQYNIYEYNKENNIIKSSCFDANDNLKWYYIYEYDDNIILKSLKRYSGDGTLETETYYE